MSSFRIGHNPQQYLQTAMKHLLALLVVFTSLPFAAHGQTVSEESLNDVLARVGSKVVTCQEFLNRVEMMPWQGKEEIALHDSVKEKALKSLVAEKLLALEAEELGVGTDERTRAMASALDRALARDELFKEEVSSRVTIPPSLLEKGMRQFARQYVVMGYGFPDEQSARSFAASCMDSAATAAAIRSLPKNVSVTDTMHVSYCDISAAYEAAIHAVDSTGITAPAYSEEEGWAVFRVFGWQTNPYWASHSAADCRSAVEKRTRVRLERRQADIYAREFSRNRTMHIDSTLFRALADTVIQYVLADTVSPRHKLSDDIDDLREAFADRLNRQFASAGKKHWTLEELLESLRFYPGPFPITKSKRAIAYALNQMIMTAVQGEMFSAEAMRRGMHKRPAVKADAASWQDSWKAGAMMQRSPDIEKHVTDLARRYGVQIFRDKLKAIPIAPFSMVTKRLLGFGGTMFAVPTILPTWNWKEVQVPQQEVAP